MSSLFEAYELLSRSSLFDAAFYLSSNPELVELNVDPLSHYLEAGGRERRDPSANFDTAYYLRQCKALGAAPDNPLLHYLTIGSTQGLHPHRQSTKRQALQGRKAAADARRQFGDAASPNLLFVDVPQISNGVATARVHGGLSVAGWALAHEGMDAVEIAVNGRRAAVAYLGIRRPDVASAYPGWGGALQSGFAAHVPPRAMGVGRHVITITARDRVGGTMTNEFAIEVEELPDRSGPWSLRRAMSQVELNVQIGLLDRLNWRPTFRILMPVAANERVQFGVRQTLATLAAQGYPNWLLCLCPTQASARSSNPSPPLPAWLTKGFEEYLPQIVTMNVTDRAASTETGQYVIVAGPGDLFACDALIQFALATGFDRDADLLYADERRASPTDGKIGAFFKPGWSPDLLLSTNYLGRSWCANSDLVIRSGLTGRDLVAYKDYDIVLRLTEAAKDIRHIPRLLFQRGEERPGSADFEQKALEAALSRRKIAASVIPGCAQHYYRVKRRSENRELVSIIVPTCAAGGHVEKCFQSLRERTAYSHYEIICIENLPRERVYWRKWLKQHADAVISINEAFNWSRFNNRAAAQANGTHFVFLNDDVEIIEPDWLDALLEHSRRPEVGVVGPQLLYPDRSVQHAGVVLDTEGRGRHAFRHLQQDDPGYFGLALTQRNVISVTGACLMTRRNVFQKLGRFEMAHPVINGDLDYCLKSWDSGFINIYTPFSRLVHHELASRGKLEERYNATVFQKRWGDKIFEGDPYFNPQLSIDNDQVEIEHEPVEEIYAGYPLFDRDAVRRVLVLKLDHIGDSITALPAVRRLKRAFPHAKLTVLAGRGTLAVWKAEASVDDSLEFNFFHVRSGLGTIDVKEADLAALEALLKQKRFDLAVDLRKQPDTRHVLQRSGARILAGFDHQGRFPWLNIAIEWDEDVPLRAKRSHVSEDLNMLIDAIAARSESPPPVVPIKMALPKFKNVPSGRVFAKPLVCVHAAAGSEMRQWPPKHFAELVDLLMSEASVNVALIGGSDDRNIAESVLKQAKRRKQVFNLVGEFGLADLPNVLSRAALFVGNNSGPQHLAASLGVPTIGIHSGVVDAHEWGPAGPIAMAIRRNMSCSPCFIEKAKDCPRALACLTGLSSRDVFERCKRMLLFGNRTRMSSSP